MNIKNIINEKRFIFQMKDVVQNVIKEMKLEEEIQHNQSINENLDNSIVRMIGDKRTLIQIIKLLAFIRYAINTHQPTELMINLNKNVANGKFMFDVNQQEIKDIILQKEIYID